MSGNLSCNGNGNVTLPLSEDDVARQLRPLEDASMLPPAAFVDQDVFDWEMKNLFADGWICLGHVSQVNEQGKFIRREIGPDSVVVVGGENGEPHAFLNVCRHRGARLIEEADGEVKRRLQCPYHAWSYALDGSLVAAPHMDGVENFDKSCFGLIPVRLAILGGLVLVDLSGEAPEPDAHVGELI
ncbi:MAG: glycine betaine catabolism, partial [Actinomycetota bacterium]|nr:glycine betaine catabolism [Actinomycetota bacterium]